MLFSHSINISMLGARPANLAPASLPARRLWAAPAAAGMILVEHPSLPDNRPPETQGGGCAQAEGAAGRPSHRTTGSQPDGLSVVITPARLGSTCRHAGGGLGRSGCPSRNRAADSGRGGAVCLSAETKLPRPEPLLLL